MYVTFTLFFFQAHPLNYQKVGKIYIFEMSVRSDGDDEYSRQLLSTYFKFIPGSKLKLFIEKRVGINPLMCRLGEVCTRC